jgi:hypothetical protein
MAWHYLFFAVKALSPPPLPRHSGTKVLSETGHSLLRDPLFFNPTVVLFFQFFFEDRSFI